MSSKISKIIMNISLSIMLTLLFAISVSAKGITIDGNLNDWKSVDKNSISSNFYKEVAFVQDGENLYMYAVETGSNPWEKYFNYTTPTLKLKNGSEVVLIITEESSSGNNSNLVVRKQNGYTIVNGSSGKRIKDKTYAYELVIPLSEFGEVKSVKINTDYSSNATFNVKKIGNQETTKPNETTKATETTKEAATTKPSETTKEQVSVIDIDNPDDSGKIIIDGKYNDWDSYPHIFVTNWNMPDDQRNENNCRSLGIAVDDDYIYFHIKMIAGWSDPLNGNEYMLSVGKYGVSLNLRLEDDRQLPQYNMSTGLYDLKVYYKNKSAHLNDETLIEDAAAIMRVYGNKPDEVEVRIPKEIFKIIHGIDVSDVKEITLTNPNLFDHGISSSATSTAPVTGIIICIITVILGLLICKRKDIIKYL